MREVQGIQGTTRITEGHNTMGGKIFEVDVCMDACMDGCKYVWMRNVCG